MSQLQKLIETIIQNNLWDSAIELERNEYLKVKGSVDTNIYFCRER